MIRDGYRKARTLSLLTFEGERDGPLRTWQTVGVFRIAGVQFAECWLVPFDQYLFGRVLVLNPLEERLPWRSTRAAPAALRKVPPATSHVGCVK